MGTDGRSEQACYSLFFELFARQIFCYPDIIDKHYLVSVYNVESFINKHPSTFMLPYGTGKKQITKNSPCEIALLHSYHRHLPAGGMDFTGQTLLNSFAPFLP